MDLTIHASTITACAIVAALASVSCLTLASALALALRKGR